MIGQAHTVSVIIPAYNSADYTVETVESVLAQTYRDVEVIVVDDGSTDHTRMAMEAFGDKLRYIYKENGGACSARNLGIRKSSGKYVACLDCDDLWLPDKLERCIAALESHLDWSLVFTPCALIDGEGKTIGYSNYSPDLDRAYVELLKGNFIVSPTVVMRRECLDIEQAFDESIFIPADWDLWLRLAHKHPIGFIDVPLSKYRMVSSYTLRHIDQYIAESIYVLDKHFSAAPELAEQDKDEILARMYAVHGNLLREKPDMAGARSALVKAIRCDPSLWSAYGHLFLSFFGQTGWGIANKVVDRLGMGWIARG